jgi:hypothetical protein
MNHSNAYISIERDAYSGWLGKWCPQLCQKEAIILGDRVVHGTGESASPFSLKDGTTHRLLETVYSNHCVG